jgi:hypothetical protein
MSPRSKGIRQKGLPFAMVNRPVWRLAEIYQSLQSRPKNETKSAIVDLGIGLLGSVLRHCLHFMYTRCHLIEAPPFRAPTLGGKIANHTALPPEAESACEWRRGILSSAGGGDRTWFADGPGCVSTQGPPRGEIVTMRLYRTRRELVLWKSSRRGRSGRTPSLCGIWVCRSGIRGHRGRSSPVQKPLHP